MYRIKWGGAEEMRVYGRKGPEAGVHARYHQRKGMRTPKETMTRAQPVHSPAGGAPFPKRVFVAMSLGECKVIVQGGMVARGSKLQAQSSKLKAQIIKHQASNTKY